ncbi:MAG: hypothetical protein DRI69_05665 [Bacteroidetes bacterium]|nr:MAG: hypothetical protein DRI69_05665 [Bacteroidota bacterium]
MSFEVEGRLHKIYDAEQKTDSFRAREFVIEVQSGQYPQMVKFQLVQDRCDLMDGYKEGAEIKVFFDLRGREWQGRYFTNLNAWKIESVGGEGAQPQFEEPAFNEPLPGANAGQDQEAKKEDFDDLPF